MVGVAGFEPATPASRTQIAVEKFNKNNEVCSRLTTFIAVCSLDFGGQSVVGEATRFDGHRSLEFRV